MAVREIYIRLSSAAPEEVTWAEVADSGDITVLEGALQTVAERKGKARIIVMVPGHDILLTSVNLGTVSKKRLAQAIPYALEDQLIGDVEEQHFAIGHRQADGTIPVAVVSMEKLDSWLAILQETGIEPDCISPECLALPYVPGAWSILVDGDLSLVRTGEQSGFVVETANLEAMLVSQLFTAGQEELETTIHLYHADPDMFQNELLRTLTVASEGGSAVDPEAPPLLIQGFSEKQAINLLQGRYSRHAQWNLIWDRWRLPAVVLFIVLFLGGVLQIYDYVRLRMEGGMLSRRIEEVYKKTFPDAKKIVNPRAQMEHQLEILQKSGGAVQGFLQLLQKSGPYLLKTSGFNLQNLRYKDGRMDIDFEVSDLKSLEDLKANLKEKSGLEVEIRTATSSGQRVQARMQIRSVS